MHSQYRRHEVGVGRCREEVMSVQMVEWARNVPTGREGPVHGVREAGPDGEAERPGQPRWEGPHRTRLLEDSVYSSDEPLHLCLSAAAGGVAGALRVVVKEAQSAAEKHHAQGCRKR